MITFILTLYWVHRPQGQCFGSFKLWHFLTVFFSKFMDPHGRSLLVLFHWQVQFPTPPYPISPLGGSFLRSCYFETGCYDDIHGLNLFIFLVNWYLALYIFSETPASDAEKYSRKAWLWKRKCLGRPDRIWQVLELGFCVVVFPT